MCCGDVQFLFFSFSFSRLIFSFSQSRLVGVPARDLELLFAFMYVKADPATIATENTSGDVLIACDLESDVATATGFSFIFFSSISSTSFP